MPGEQCLQKKRHGIKAKVSKEPSFTFPLIKATTKSLSITTPRCVLPSQSAVLPCLLRGEVNGT